MFLRCGGLLAGLLFVSHGTSAADSYSAIVHQVNQKTVKIYGAGGFRGITPYCSGVLVSPEGHILTVYSPTLDSRELRVHLFDGNRLQAELITAEPQLDVALLRIKSDDPSRLLSLSYFDLTQKPPEPVPGDRVLAFSNLYEIATGNEPVSVQQGVLAAVTPLAARRGIHEVSYKGAVYIVDAITNNPGALGGAVTTRKGELIGLIGKELRNTLTETWVNYALPAKNLSEFVAKAKTGKYQPIARIEEVKKDAKPIRHGIVLVPDVLDLTPPYVEEVLPGSPAAKAGLKADDLIVMIRVPVAEGGEPEDRLVNSCKAFKQAMALATPGTAVRLTVRRGMELVSVDVNVEEDLKPGK